MTENAPEPNPPETRIDRIGRFVGMVAVVLGVCVAFLFPMAAAAGTETPTMRWVTAAALVVAGLIFHQSRGRWTFGAVATVVLVAASAMTGAKWLGAFVVYFVLEAGVAFLAERRRWWTQPARSHEDEAATDIVESIATAFILALVVREFAFEAFKIPTGSMEPTIYGEGFGRRKGDRLLASKAPLLFCEPQRFSIMVFKYPLFRPTNYIKRLVGLPGEHVENRGGDIYVNEKIVCKPEEVQESLWRALWPSEESRPSEDGVGAAFQPDNDGKWEFLGDAATATVPAGKTGWIGRDTGYADVRASFDVDASGLGADGAVLVRIDGGGRRVELEARRDSMWLTAPGAVGTDGPESKKMKLDVDGLGASTSRLGFAVADRVVRVYRDGRLVARVETADATNMDGRGDHTSIGVSGATAKVSKVKLEHDLQYSQQGSGDWHVPDGCYFMLGDNTTQSRDSRAWQGRVFHLKNGGEIVADLNEVRLDDDVTTSSIHDAGDAYDILDSYGVKRRVMKSDLVDGTFKTEPRPFVKRDDLVGRAFLIFFPFPPFGEWRPRILP